MFFRDMKPINKNNLLWYSLQFITPRKIVEECSLHNDSGEFGNDVLLSMNELAEFLISEGLGNTTGLKKLLKEGE
tara:strand:- start:2688 stop:2912 length:225 start_codon:yes stop_codon:yes gene_type:complete